MSRRKLDLDRTRERLVALGLAHAADQLEPLLSCHRRRKTDPPAPM